MIQENAGFPFYVRLSCIQPLMIALCSCLIIISGCLGHQEINPPHNESPVQTSKTISVIDSLNNTVTFTSPVKRLVVQNFDAVELLMALGAEDSIVGVPENVLADPEFRGRLQNARSIGDWRRPNPETLLELKPDAVIMLTSKTYNMDAINPLNLTIIYIDCWKIETLPDDARLLGKITDREIKAEEYVVFLEKYQNLVLSRVPSSTERNKTRVYAEKYNDYNPQGMGSGIHELIEQLGAENVAAGLPENTRVSPEWVIDQNPEIILKFVTSSTLDSGETLESTYARVMNRTGAANSSAVHHHRVYVLHGDPFFSPRAVVGMIYLGKILYPEQFSDVNPEDALQEYGQKFVSGFEQTRTMYPPIY